MTPLFISGDALLQALGIGGEDILANREGRLGPRQLAQSRRLIVRLTIGSATIGLLFLCGGFISRSNGGQVLVPWLFAGLALVLAAVFAYGAARGTPPPVRTLYGHIEVIAIGEGRGGSSAGLRVQGWDLRLPPAINLHLASDVRAWHDLIDPKQRYAVYVVGLDTAKGPSQVVGIEPDW